MFVKSLRLGAGLLFLSETPDGAGREPNTGVLPCYMVAGDNPRRLNRLSIWRCTPMRAPIFGLSTTPITEIKSELRLQLERDLRALVYRSPR
jgi:hypothetical protein